MIDPYQASIKSPLLWWWCTFATFWVPRHRELSHSTCWHPMPIQIATVQLQFQWVVAIVTGVISQLVVVIMVIDIIKVIPTAPPIFINWIANPTTYRSTNRSSVYNPFIPKYAMNNVIKCFFLMPRCPRCPVPASQDSDPVLYSPSFVWVSKVLNHLQFLGRTSTMKSTPMCKIIKSWSTGKPLAWKRSPTEISTPISQDLYCSSHVKNAPLISPMISPFRRSRVPQLKKTLPIWKMPCKKLKILCWWT